MATFSGTAAPGEEIPEYDLFIVGGGVNGAGIARDAAGRGFSVCLCEAGDFAGGTSSASTKLFHGGLRYLEYFEFRLVREALTEREVLWQAMPHISWPMRFVLPYREDMRFEASTPASRLLGLFMPWMKGRRPAWMIRFGLFCYDHLGGRHRLPPTRTLDLALDPAGKPLKPKFRKAFEYSDCWVEDSRLVILNLRDAGARGATVLPRTRVVRAEYAERRWNVELEDATTGARHRVRAAVIVNATGPWVDEVLKSVFGRNEARHVRLVRGSHIVIRRKYDHDRCYFFQNADSRIIFAIPYESDFTLIGTTDADHADIQRKPEITPDEIDYLCAMASEYFTEPVRPDDIVWTYSGVRPLFDDGASAAAAATRDYVIRPDARLGEGSLINLFGGKITTYRRLSEHAMELVEARLGTRGPSWTRGVPLPGGDFPADSFERLVDRYHEDFPFVPEKVMHRLVRLYGTECDVILADCRAAGDLGRHFGAGLYEVELAFLMAHEWARTAEDVLFRRTRLGIRMNRDEIDAVQRWMVAATETAGRPGAADV